MLGFLLSRSYLYGMIETTQPKKRGRKPAIKLEVAPQIVEIEGEIEGIKVSFYYGSEKAKQKKLIKITHEIKSFKKIR